MTELEILKKSFKSVLFDRESHRCFPHGRSHNFVPHPTEKTVYLPANFLLYVIDEIQKGTWSKEWYDAGPEPVSSRSESK